MARIEITNLSTHKQPPTSGRTFLIPDRGQASCSQTDQLCAKLPLITNKQETTPTCYAQYGRGRIMLLLIILPFVATAKNAIDFSKFLSFLN